MTIFAFHENLFEVLLRRTIRKKADNICFSGKFAQEDELPKKMTLRNKRKNIVKECFFFN